MPKFLNCRLTGHHSSHREYHQMYRLESFGKDLDAKSLIDINSELDELDREEFYRLKKV